MATARLYLDRLKANGLHPVRIRITDREKRKYYPTHYDLSKSEFDDIDKAIKGEKNLRRSDIITIKNDLESQLHTADAILRKLGTRFSFAAYKKMAKSGNKNSDVKTLFDQYIKKLENSEKIGTASSYTCAKNSIIEFQNDLTIYGITTEFLESYQKWMLANGKSETTIGIYLRSLRSIFNNAIEDGIIEKEAYPFKGKKGFKIPEPKRRKLALSVEELLKLWNYQPTDEAEARVKDFWFISYFASGLNFKDLALLRQSNFRGEEIVVIREKTKGKELEEIGISITDRLTECIARRRVHRIGTNPFVFDILNEKDSPKEQFKKIRQFIKTSNKYLKQIGKKLELSIPVTTYVARHSYATIAKTLGISIEAISEALGHSDTKTTQSYLDSFPTEQKRRNAEKIASFGL